MYEDDVISDEPQSYTRRDTLKYMGGAAVAGMTSMAGCTDTFDTSEKLDDGANNIWLRVSQREHLNCIEDTTEYGREDLVDRLHRDTPVVDDENIGGNNHEMYVELDNTKIDPCLYREDTRQAIEAFTDEEVPVRYFQNMLEIMIDELWHVRPEQRRYADAVSDYTIRLKGVEHERFATRPKQGWAEYSTNTVHIEDMLKTYPEKEAARIDTQQFKADFDWAFNLGCDDRTYREVAHDTTRRPWEWFKDWF